jgi:segregation and condensation protein A
MEPILDFQADLEIFRGPLDLLLYLVKRDEVDILDIPITRILDQFRAYLRVIEMLDVERAGDFLVMASTLMEIKSKMVLPRPEHVAATEEEDPRRELVKQLIEYKKFKDAAAQLELQAEKAALRLSRQQPPPPHIDPSKQQLRPVELWDLVSAFGRLMRETLALQPQQISLDHTPIHVYVEQIVERLRLQPDNRLPLSALFTPPHSRGRLAGLFLAILELTKGKTVLAEQAEAFGDIWLSLLPASAAAVPAEHRPEAPSLPPPSISS